MLYAQHATIISAGAATIRDSVAAKSCWSVTTGLREAEIDMLFGSLFGAHEPSSDTPYPTHTCLDCLNAAACQCREQELLRTDNDGVQSHPFVLQDGMKSPQAGLE